MTFLQRYRTEIILVALSLAFHAAYFFFVVQANDSNVLESVRADDGYYEVAVNLLAGNGFSMATTSPYVPNALRTPGYIYLLAGLLGITGSASATAIIQLLIASILPVLGMHIARHITDSTRTGVITGAILALDPTLAILSFNFYTDTLFLVFFFAWLLVTFRYLERPKWLTLVAGAVILGLAIITRPTAQYIPILLIPFILWRFGAQEWRRSLAHILAYLVIVGAILVPWIMRNYNEFGAPGLSAQKQYVLYTNFAPAVLSVARGSDFATEFTTFSTYEERAGGAITSKNGDEYTAKALDIVFAHPIASAYVVSKSLYTFFMNDGMYAFLTKMGYAPYDYLWLLVPARLAWVAITVAMGIGALVYLLTRRSLLAIFILLLVAYFALSSTIAAFGTNPRYRLPVDPIIVALAVVGATYLYERIRVLRRVWDI